MSVTRNFIGMEPLFGTATPPVVVARDLGTQYFVTSDGTSSGAISQSWTYTRNGWIQVPLSDSTASLSAIGELTEDMTGFVDRISSDYSFDTASRTYTLSPTGADFPIYHKGTLYVVASPLSIVIDATEGGRYIYFDPTTQQLAEVLPVGSHPNIKGQALVAYIYWDGAKAIILGDERHNVGRDTQWHYNQHLDVGAIWRSGGAISFTEKDDSAVTLEFSNPIKLADEDLEHTISNAAVPSGHYQQLLAGPAANLPVLYLDGTHYTETTAATVPWMHNSNVAVYNQIVGGSGSLTQLANSTFVNYWVLFSNDSQQPVKLVLGRQEHSTVADAEAETFDDYGLSLPEMVIGYKIVCYYKTSYTNNDARIWIEKVLTLTGDQNQSSVFSTTAHQNLTGTTLTDCHPIEAITGLRAELDSLGGGVVEMNDLSDVFGGDFYKVLPTTGDATSYFDGISLMYINSVGGYTPTYAGSQLHGLDLDAASGNIYHVSQNNMGSDTNEISVYEGSIYLMLWYSSESYALSTTPDGTHGGGIKYDQEPINYYTDTVNGFVGIRIPVSDSLPNPLYYYDEATPGKGGTINIINKQFIENSVSNISLSLGDLSNVDTSTTPPTDGQSLTWDNTASKWVPGSAPAGVTTLAALNDTDVATIAPIDYDVLAWDNTAGDWKPAYVPKIIFEKDLQVIPITTDTSIENGVITLSQAGENLNYVDVAHSYDFSKIAFYRLGNNNEIVIHDTVNNTWISTIITGLNPLLNGVGWLNDKFYLSVRTSSLSTVYTIDPDTAVRTQITSSGAPDWSDFYPLQTNSGDVLVNYPTNGTEIGGNLRIFSSGGITQDTTFLNGDETNNPPVWDNGADAYIAYHDKNDPTQLKIAHWADGDFSVPPTVPAILTVSGDAGSFKGAVYTEGKHYIFYENTVTGSIEVYTYVDGGDLSLLNTTAMSEIGKVIGYNNNIILFSTYNPTGATQYTIGTYDTDDDTWKLAINNVNSDELVGIGLTADKSKILAMEYQGSTTSTKLLIGDIVYGKAAITPERPAYIIDDLDNVQTTSKTDGDVLTWDITSGKWIPGSGGATVINDLVDVNANPVNNGDLLAWNAFNSEWSKSDGANKVLIGGSNGITNYPLTFALGTSGYQAIRVDSNNELTYNPSSNTITLGTETITPTKIQSWDSNSLPTPTVDGATLRWDVGSGSWEAIDSSQFDASSFGGVETSRFIGIPGNIITSNAIINLAASSYYRLNFTTSRSVSLINGTLDADKVYSGTLFITLSGGASVTWDTKLVWPEGTPPTMNDGNHVVTVTTIDAGVTFYGNYLTNFA